jgi:hypothetical protein
LGGSKNDLGGSKNGLGVSKNGLGGSRNCVGLVGAVGVWISNISATVLVDRL